MKVSSWDHGPVRCLQLDQPGVLFWPLTEDIREYSRSVSQGRASPDGECLSEGLPRRAGLLGSECPPPRSVDSTMVNSTMYNTHLPPLQHTNPYTANQTQTFANIFFEVKGTKSWKNWFSEPCCAYTLQRASWLLPIVNHGIDTEDEVKHFSSAHYLQKKLI